ncbi:hypothetical protein PPL_03791 [Heterostelium album PN500]|uniref:Kri1-like C-terminal domain-containing protein n=1 Tax=Heterostelium pallidum (strain ATCC 26659 / Pp 5 / PN500) TaxID=670386 RepID=D3B6N9_HETP5|nr:hypothetical protein PPL_03791 [Heterostelium album PN500]EFA83009.1 hypothetical protein PPL_03791 [Heterostelium album PN500]|eukprot:XP_020435126.1 hypothetical protein PPL_03791 [Heterostelium album PN500]
MSSKNKKVEKEDISSSESESSESSEVSSESDNQQKKNDKSLYNKELRFFDEKDRPIADPSDANKDNQKQKITLQQINRDKILSTMDKDQYEEDDEEEEEEEDEGNYQEQEEEEEEEEDFEEMSYNRKQEHLKNAFKLADEDEDSDDADKKRTEQEEEKENEEFEEFKKRISEKGYVDTEAVDDYWRSKKVDDDEKFLRDYILSQKWMTDKTKLPTYEEIVDEMEQDEKDLDKQALYEKSFNFRFEEAGSTVIVSNPRQVDDSMRRTTSKRAEKRAKKRERQEQEQTQNEEKLKKYKNEKKKEILEKLKEINEITGSTAFNMSDADLKKMDPSVLMKEIKSSKKQKVEQQQQYDDDEDQEYYEDEGDYNEEDGGDYNYNDEEGGDNQFSINQLIESGIFDDEDDEGEEDWDEERIQREKKELESMLDNYYGMDYQEMIDDTPVRFKYTKVDADDYGMSLDDILMKDDKELERMVPLQKMAPYINQMFGGQSDGTKHKRQFAHASKYHTWSEKTFVPKAGKNKPTKSGFASKPDNKKSTTSTTTTTNNKSNNNSNNNNKFNNNNNKINESGNVENEGLKKKRKNKNKNILNK